METEGKVKGIKLKKAVRKASALLLSKRCRTRGAPRSRIEKIFNKEDIPTQLGIRAMKDELEDVGIKLKEIEEEWRGTTITRYIGVLDPQIEIEDIRPYNRNITAILALVSAKGKRVPFSEIRDELEKIVDEKEEAEKLLSSAIGTLTEDGVVKFNQEKGMIEVTDYGEALLPSQDIIKSVIIDTLVSGKNAKE